MRGRRLAAFVLVLAGLLAVPAAASEPDPRVAEADALLGDASAYPRAVDLYRAALAAAPEEREVRRRLARVLSWSRRWDESLAEYDRLLAQPDPAPDLALERAEVLSWAGRNDEAIAGFEAALVQDPGNARAARGLARSHRWAGSAAQADRAYERALALEEDAELRGEWAALRAGFPPRAAADAELYADNDDYRRLESGLTASFFRDLDTHVTVRAAALDVRSGGSAAAPALAENDRGGEATLSVRRRLGSRLEAELEAGARVWREAGAGPLARARLQYIAGPGSVFALEIDHRDALERTDSVAALEDGVHDTQSRLTAWRAFGSAFEAFAEAGAGALSDGNLRSGAGATFTWRPFLERELRVNLAAGYLGYTKRSTLYYDPDVDVSGLLLLTHRQPLPWRLELDLEAGGGWGWARQDGGSSDGPAYQVATALAWRVGRVRVQLRASRAQSQRESDYVANRLFATLGLDFPR